MADARDLNEPTDPRRAALNHAAVAEQLVAAAQARGEPMAPTGEVASAIACGLVYIGDQIGQLGEWLVSVETVAQRLRAVASGLSEAQMKTLFGEDLERIALRDLERAARDLDALLGGNPGEWTLASRTVPSEAGQVLIELHDHLNDVKCAREDPDTYRRYLTEIGRTNG